MSMYSIMILTQMFTFYWHSNEVREESMDVANAVYDIQFWDFTNPMKTKLMMIIQRAQNPMNVSLFASIKFIFIVNPFRLL